MEDHDHQAVGHESSHIFRRMKFFKAVAVGFSGLSSLDGGSFRKQPGTIFVKIESGGQTPFTEMMCCFFFELPISFNSQRKPGEKCGWKTMHCFLVCTTFHVYHRFNSHDQQIPSRWLHFIPLTAVLF